MMAEHFRLSPIVPTQDLRNRCYDAYWAAPGSTFNGIDAVIDLVLAEATARPDPARLVAAINHAADE